MRCATGQGRAVRCSGGIDMQHRTKGFAMSRPALSQPADLQSAHLQPVDQASRFVWLVAWLALALALLWPQGALAQNCPSPQTASVAHGGTVDINLAACEFFPGAGIGPVVTQPTHGTVVEHSPQARIVYSHFGGGNIATSDSFVFNDGDGHLITVNISIGARSSCACATPLTALVAPGPTPVEHTPGRRCKMP